MGFHVLLQGIFPTQGSNLCPLPLQVRPLAPAQPRAGQRKEVALFKQLTAEATGEIKVAATDTAQDRKVKMGENRPWLTLPLPPTSHLHTPLA